MRITAKQHTELVQLNAKAEEEFRKVKSAVEAFNAAREALYERLDGLAADLRGEYDAKSERWQESDRGSAASEWLDGLENLRDGIDEELEVEEPEWIEGVKEMEVTPSE